MVADDDREKKLWKQGYKLICAVDESGMGSFVSDVYVGAIIFPEYVDYKRLMPGLDDSKKKTPIQREILYKQIKNCALYWSVETASVNEINELNIYWARFLAARRAIKNLGVTPDYVLMDGNKIIPEIDIPQQAIVKGDQKSMSIAAASILAKVDRDRHMDEIAKLVHPDYGWSSNRGYYCKQTIESLKKHGKTKWHRQKYVEKYLENK